MAELRQVNPIILMSAIVWAIVALRDSRPGFGSGFARGMDLGHVVVGVVLLLAPAV